MIAETISTNYKPLERFVRIKEVMDLTGLSRSYIYDLAKRGLFPQSVSLVPGGNARAWVLSEVLNWQEDRITERENTNVH